MTETDTSRALVDLIRSAVKFANLAAGEGLSIAGLQPEEFMMAYSGATGFEDWDNLDSHAASTLTAALDEIAILRTEKHADAEAIGALRAVNMRNAANALSAIERAEKAEGERDTAWNDAIEAAAKEMNPVLRSMLSRGDAQKAILALKKGASQ